MIEGERAWLNHAETDPSRSAYDELITRRSQVQILPPLLKKTLQKQGLRLHHPMSLDDLTNLILEQARVLYAYWPEVFASPLATI